jgi:hypothetical protein
MTRLAVHVAAGVREDEHADRSGEEGDEEREAVNVERKRDAEGRNPLDGDGSVGPLTPQRGYEPEARERDGGGVVGRALAEYPIDERREGRADEGQKHHGEDVRGCRLHG